jgi:hypothetical protein
MTYMGITPEREALPPIANEILALCAKHLQNGIDELKIGDTTIELVEGHGAGIYAEARMMIDYISDTPDGRDRTRGYIILNDRVLNHPGSATKGETFSVGIDELNQVLKDLKTASPIETE